MDIDYAKYIGEATFKKGNFPEINGNFKRNEPGKRKTYSYC